MSPNPPLDDPHPDRVGVVIPARNEEESIGAVVQRCHGALAGWSYRICVADNDSHDQTRAAASAAGAEVVEAHPPGYGLACLRCIAHFGSWPDILLFLDGDGSSRPEEAPRLLRPIVRNQADLVIGVRPPDAPMTPPQRWGTLLAAQLIRLRWGCPVGDIGPFRAIRHGAFHQLQMQDQTWGWTVEMQILAHLHDLRVLEVPVSWDKRLAGKSKISGTVMGVARAGARILWTLGKYGFRSASAPRKR